MSADHIAEKSEQETGTRVELGEPVPFEGETSRPLVIAAALGAPSGSRDPVDVALLRAASEREDLRHYEQLGFTPLDPHSRHSVARVRKRGADVEKLIARGDVEDILGLIPAGARTRCRAAMQLEAKLTDGYRGLAVAILPITACGKGGWRLLGYIPVRVSRTTEQRAGNAGASGSAPVWDLLLKWFKIR